MLAPLSFARARCRAPPIHDSDKHPARHLLSLHHAVPRFIQPFRILTPLSPPRTSRTPPSRSLPIAPPCSAHRPCLLVSRHLPRPRSSPAPRVVSRHSSSESPHMHPTTSTLHPPHPPCHPLFPQLLYVTFSTRLRRPKAARYPAFRLQTHPTPLRPTARPTPRPTLSARRKTPPSWAAHPHQNARPSAQRRPSRAPQPQTDLICRPPPGSRRLPRARRCASSREASPLLLPHTRPFRDCHSSCGMRGIASRRAAAGGKWKEHRVVETSPPVATQRLTDRRREGRAAACLLCRLFSVLHSMPCSLRSYTVLHALPPKAWECLFCVDEQRGGAQVCDAGVGVRHRHTAGAS